MRHGFGSWREVASFSDFERMSLYYACRQQDGDVIDWNTGEITPPKQS